MDGMAMSFPLNDPNLRVQSVAHLSLRERVAEALHRATAGERSAAKVIARASGKTPKMAEKWLRAENTPNAEALAALCRHFDAVWEVMREEAGRANDMSDAERILAEFAARLGERRR